MGDESKFSRLRLRAATVTTSIAHTLLLLADFLYPLVNESNGSDVTQAARFIMGKLEYFARSCECPECTFLRFHSGVQLVSPTQPGPSPGHGRDSKSNTRRAKVVKSSTSPKQSCGESEPPCSSNSPTLSGNSVMHAPCETPPGERILSAYGSSGTQTVSRENAPSDPSESTSSAIPTSHK